MEHYVQNKVVIITGGSSGFGLETARILLEMGAKVVITGRNQERLDAAAQDLASEDLLAVRADAVKTEDWRTLMKKTLERFGRLDVLVNNHGAGVKIAPVEEMDDESIETILDINITSVIKGCREAIRAMKGQGSGHIVNVSSGCATQSFPNWGSYTAAKAGMVGFTRCLHLEMVEWGGKATNFIPGAAKTHFCDAAGIDTSWQEGFPTAHDFARTLVHCIDVPASSFIEEVSIWGTKQVINPF
jgi:NAD(P)-dependent dehydrogenase (short-subunit alcohol dehydrogenase family)